MEASKKWHVCNSMASPVTPTSGRMLVSIDEEYENILLSLSTPNNHRSCATRSWRSQFTKLRQWADYKLWKKCSADNQMQSNHSTAIVTLIIVSIASDHQTSIDWICKSTELAIARKLPWHPTNPSLLTRCQGTISTASQYPLQKPMHTCRSSQPASLVKQISRTGIHLIRSLAKSG